MTRFPVTLRNRFCTTLPMQTRPRLSIFLSWLVATDTKFRRAQTLLHPPGRWP